MDADGEQRAGADRDGVLDVGALTMLVKKGDEQEPDHRAGNRGCSDLGADDRGSSWAQVRIGQMTLAPGTGGHQVRLGNAPR